MRLERDDVPGNATDNVVIYFADDLYDAAGRRTGTFRSQVCPATSVSILNTPYAADEDYAFKAELDVSPGEMLVWVLQKYRECQAGGASSETLQIYRSDDEGRSWTKQAMSDERKQEFERKQIFSDEKAVAAGFRIC